MNNNLKLTANSRKIINTFFWMVISLAVILRFSHLDKKVFWHDEIYTQLRVSGYKNIDPRNARFGKIVSKDDLMIFQNVSSQKGIKDTLESLSEDVHTPLYYIVLKYWQYIFGNSISAVRALSAIFSALCIPAMYILTKELFESEDVAKISTILMAISPIFIRYAQDARPYSLWALLGILSTYQLLKALKTNNLVNWIYYSITILLTSYTQLLSLYLYIGHFVYVIATKKADKSTLLRYLLSSIMGVVLFLPWIFLVVIPNYPSMAAQTIWLKMSIGLKNLFNEQIINLNHLFHSLDLNSVNYSVKCGLGLILTVAIGYSISLTVNKTELKIWLLPFCLSLSSYIFLYQDLLSGGQRTRVNQYFLFSYIAIFLVVGLAIFVNLTSQKKNKVNIWLSILAAMIIFSLTTSFQTSTRNTWWGWSSFEVDMAKIINQTENPLLISQERIGNIMPTIYLLKDNAKSLMLNLEQKNLPANIANYDSFLLNPDQEVKDTYQNLSGHKLKHVYNYTEGLLNINLYKSI